MTRTRSQRSFLCPICHQNRSAADISHTSMIRPAVVEKILKDHPECSESDFICHSCLSQYRAAYITDLLQKDKGEVSQLEQDVIDSMHQHELLSENINEQFDSGLTFGQRIADKVADFGGSWRFILLFAGILVSWIVINVISLFTRPFDPYPFILLNLILSCLAAVQAPIIMMSQNRQEAKDRLRSENDYRINLKAELEIRHLISKIDLLMEHQWQHLLELQEIQLDIMNELAHRRTRTASPPSSSPPVGEQT